MAWMTGTSVAWLLFFLYSTTPANSNTSPPTPAQTPAMSAVFDPSESSSAPLLLLPDGLPAETSGTKSGLMATVAGTSMGATPVTPGMLLRMSVLMPGVVPLEKTASTSTSAVAAEKPLSSLRVMARRRHSTPSRSTATPMSITVSVLLAAPEKKSRMVASRCSRSSPWLMHASFSVSASETLTVTTLSSGTSKASIIRSRGEMSKVTCAPLRPPALLVVSLRLVSSKRRPTLFLLSSHPVPNELARSSTRRYLQASLGPV
mmetsp:Transcript_43638/g.103116  ORF Transcript_43638/g.103116 Transcript_43638/m.103116 type:complete len:261 (+) Transcript_43638:229-1011(+)